MVKECIVYSQWIIRTCLRRRKIRILGKKIKNVKLTRRDQVGKEDKEDEDNEDIRKYDEQYNVEKDRRKNTKNK